MSDLGERLTKVAVTPSNSAIQKRQNIAAELQSISALVEEMLTMAKRSYSPALTASHMGRLAYEHNVTIMQLRNRNADLQNEIHSWVIRSSQDSTAAMIFAEENVVLAKANAELSARMQELNGRQRKQSEILGGLLTATDFGLPSTVLNEALPSEQALLGLLDLPGTYSRLIGELREPIANNKGDLSILAPTPLATRSNLIDSIERQLSRPFGHDLNVANEYLNVAQTRAQEAMQRGLTVYGEKRIPQKGMESIFNCEPSGLRCKLPPHLKAPLPIASELSAGLLGDLQNRGSIVFCDHFFDAAGNQMQDMQVARDPLPATALMANAMNTSDALSDLLRQGNIPRLLNQELKERKPLKKSVESQPKVFSSSSLKTEARSAFGGAPEAHDPNAFEPKAGSIEPRGKTQRLAQ
jgi:hypothetical protein